MTERGRRWNENESVPLDWIDAAYEKRKALGLPRVNLVIEAVKFANYWAAKSGKGATHVRWSMVWMNWALNAYGAVPEPEPHKPSTETQRAVDRVKLALAGKATLNFNPRVDVPIALSAGAISKTEASKLGF